MPPSTSVKRSPRSRVRLSALLASAGLIVTAATLSAPLPAVAAPAPTAAITLSTATVSPYGWVGITSATGFGPNDPLTVTIDGADVTGWFPNRTTDSSGSITTPLGSAEIPGTSGGAVGTHTFVVTDATAGLTASAAVQVVPAPSPTPPTAQRTVSQMRTTGATIAFSGFAPGDSTTFTMMDTTHVGQCAGPLTADASGDVTVNCAWNGAFSTTFAAFGPGQYMINGGNSTGTRYSDSATVTVTADPAPAPAPSPDPPVDVPPVTMPVAASPVAAPAVPVSSNAHFTG